VAIKSIPRSARRIFCRASGPRSSNEFVLANPGLDLKRLAYLPPLEPLKAILAMSMSMSDHHLLVPMCNLFRVASSIPRFAWGPLFICSLKT
jgi:hypothetical protein